MDGKGALENFALRKIQVHICIYYLNYLML